MTGRTAFGGPGALILALDVGTSSCRASLYDARGRPTTGTGARISYSPTVTDDGGAELAPEQLLERVAETIDLLAHRTPRSMERVSAVAISSFWHSLLGVDGSGRAMTPIYLWMDARSREAAEELKGLLDEDEVHARTGCGLHWSYLPAKLLWLSRTRPELFRRARHWLSFGEYLTLRLFDRRAVSVSTASATGLFNQHSCDWDDAILAALPIERDQLSPITPLRDAFAGLRDEFARRWPSLSAVPWLAPLGDGACSNLGAGCTTRERLALMVGTSGAMRVAWRTKRLEIPGGVWCYRADEGRPVMGGALNDGGSLLLWLRDSLRLPPPEKLEAEVAAMEPDAHGLTLLPLWAGERSPGWAADARGAIVGLRLHTLPSEIARAAMEAVALRFALVQGIIEEALPGTKEVVATGGALLHSPAWMQIMADVLGRPVLASREMEASSRGAALMALELLDLLPGTIEAMPLQVERGYEPVPAHTERYRAAGERQRRLYEMLVGK